MSKFALHTCSDTYPSFEASCCFPTSLNSTRWPFLSVRRSYMLLLLSAHLTHYLYQTPSSQAEAQSTGIGGVRMSLLKD